MRRERDRMKVREYLKNRPEALSEREFEGGKRRKIIMMRGIGPVERVCKEEVKEIIKKYLGLVAYIKRITVIGES